LTDTLQPLPEFLTTREVADLLRVKERKVYDMAAAGEIPHRRLTGKLLFPRSEILAWAEGPSSGRPAVIAGSHDPLLDWAVRESGCGLATLFDGSMDGLARYRRHEAALAGMHIPDGDDWNIPTLEGAGLHDAVLIAWAVRSQGLIVRPDETARSVADLRGRRVAMRQEGAGGRALFDLLAAKEELSPEDFGPPANPARTETEAAAAIASGDADAALGLEAMARQFGLAFVPLVTERFDVLIDRRAYFTDPVQTLLAFTATPAFLTKASALGGYSIENLGAVRWLSP
jgi:excisionase family DNA binding protein